MEVFIVSGDKDFAQLVSERVRMVDTLRDVTYDPELVRKKWGVRPEQFVDLLALMGDKVDNIPGVPGIGAKGAAGLLGTYGSLDAVLEHVEELKGRQRTTLEENRELAELSRELATIECHVPLKVGLEDLRLTLPEPSSLNALFKELEFHSLLTADATADEEEAEDVDYGPIKSLDEIDTLLAELPSDEVVAVYGVYDGHSPVYGRLVGIAFSTQAAQARLVPVFGQDGLGQDGLERLRAFFEDAERHKVTYNAKYLWIALRRLKIDLAGVVGDVLLESFLVDPTKLIPHELGQVVREYLRRTVPPAKQVLGSGKKVKYFSQIELEKLFPWICQRADVVGRAWPAGVGG